MVLKANSMARAHDPTRSGINGFGDGVSERRKHQRYDAAAIGCRVEWINSTAEAPEAKNLSAGGLCLRTDRLLAPGEQIYLKLSLPEPMGSALVQCVVRWRQPAPDSSGWLIGAEVIESTKAWIGPQEDCRQENTL
jgi:hypothetical protein